MLRSYKPAQLAEDKVFDIYILCSTGLFIVTANETEESHSFRATSCSKSSIGRHYKVVLSSLAMSDSHKVPCKLINTRIELNKQLYENVKCFTYVLWKSNFFEEHLLIYCSLYFSIYL